LSYPIHSALGLAVVATFAGAFVLTCQPSERRMALTAAAKSLVFSAIVLFTPGIGLYRAWAEVAAVSARLAFSDELTTYGRQYSLPYFWHDGPVAVRAVILAALGLIALRRMSRPMLAVVFSLGRVGVGSQVETVARVHGLFDNLLERLPRPFYNEFYIPLFYATAAAYVINHASQLAPALKFRRTRTRQTAGV